MILVDINMLSLEDNCSGQKDFEFARIFKMRNLVQIFWSDHVKHHAVSWARVNKVLLLARAELQPGARRKPASALLTSADASSLASAHHLQLPAASGAAQSRAGNLWVPMQPAHKRGLQPLGSGKPFVPGCFHVFFNQLGMSGVSFACNCVLSGQLNIAGCESVLHSCTFPSTVTHAFMHKALVTALLALQGSFASQVRLHHQAEQRQTHK